MFAMIITDMNEKIDEQTAMINVLMAHEHEIKQQENIVFEVEPHKHQNENLVDKKVFDDAIYNINWQLKAIEERVVEIQARLSPVLLQTRYFLVVLSRAHVPSTH